jgi:hypothetical protein
MSAAAGSNPDLYAVAVCYQVAPAPFIARLVAETARAGRRLRAVVVSNDPSHPLQSPAAGVEVIRGSNAQLDFSGYFEGFDRLLSTDPGAAGANVLFANDSLLTRHALATILRHVLQLDGLLGQLLVPAMAGKLDPYRSICLRSPWSGHPGYLSSFCFLLNRHAQPRLTRLPAEARDDGVLAACPVEAAEWGAGLAPVLREYIRAHLAYDRSAYLWRASAAAHTELIRKKAQCVYFEHRLSGSIGVDGALLPINAGPRSRARIALAETAARAVRALVPYRR